ncbi:methyl-accepting chemotaxis protein [Arenibaculum pallidiluteum]|uniref:methyl-accepting chemotaxis protein n=1 Tax=Arenibaculum pallidiluteum TaxID=2812559 RepID=UPI001A967871|nr:methyl-accepting chemotaxis protein [Arenibaculum pallidiluteum]
MRVKLTIRAKLWVLVGAASVACLAIAAAGLRVNRDRMVEDRIATLRSVVEAGHSLASGLEAEAAAGRISRDEAQARFKQAVLTIRYSGGEYLFSHTYASVGFAHMNTKLMGADVSGIKDRNGVPIIPALIDITRGDREGTYVYDWPKTPGGTEHAVKLAYAKGFDPWTIFIGTGVFIDDIDAAFRAQLWRMAVIVGALALPAIALIALVGQNVSTAVRGLSAKMRAIAAGDLSAGLPEAGRSDEIGAMAQAVQVFKEQAQAKIRLEAERERIKSESENERHSAMMAVAETFEHSVGGVLSAVSDEMHAMESKAQEMSRVAQETGRLSAAVASATEETSANVQTVAAAAEQLAGSIDEIARQVAQSSRKAGQAVDRAKQADGKVAGLAATVERIGTVVELINSIAGQTNLLALNATIEAARAGEAGKGFAVVASEVKALASQTGRATEDIASQVAAIQSVTGEAVHEIQGVAEVIERVNAIAAAISAAVEEQGAATREISRNIQQAAQGTRAVLKSIGGVSAAADQGGGTSQNVLETSRRLALQVDSLDREVSGFLTTVRAS